MSKEKKSLTSISNGVKKVWEFHKPKDSGVVGAGEFGGFFTTEYTENGKLVKQMGLIKHDSRYHLNIAEFLASRIYQNLIPQASAVVDFVPVPGAEIPSKDGKGVYIVAEFVPNYKGTLYEGINKTLRKDELKKANEGLSSEQIDKIVDKENHGLSNIMAVESAQIFTMLMKTNTVKKAFDIAREEGNYLNFAEVMVTSLLINNIDTHLANIVVRKVERKDGTKADDLAVIDYGVAWRDMTDTINPHSILKYIKTHAIRTEAWNNFVFYDNSLKIRPEFVAELDRVASANLSDIFDKAFEEIGQYYGPEPIVEFALRTGLINKTFIKVLKNLHERDESKYKEALIDKIKSCMIASLNHRQEDLSRFSAQIKVDLCLQKSTKNNY